MKEAQGISIQTLGSEHLDVMRAMLSMFGEAFGETATYTAAQPDDAYLQGLLASDAFFAIAALAEGQVVGGLAALGARRVAYISCNPATLARDAAVLAAQGFVLSRLALVDMFPQTHHVEALALFERR